MNKEELEVQRVLDSLRPAMEADGGGIDLVSVQEGTVLVKFKGSCIICPSNKLTLKLGIEPALIDNLVWVKEVKIAI